MIFGIHPEHIAAVKQTTTPFGRDNMLEDVAPKQVGSIMCSSLDAASGFLQITLNELSKKITTFITPFDKYMFKWLPFGINCEWTFQEWRQNHGHYWWHHSSWEICWRNIIVGWKEHCRFIKLPVWYSTCVSVDSTCPVWSILDTFGIEVVSLCPDKVATIRDLPPPTNHKWLV